MSDIDKTNYSDTNILSTEWQKSRQKISFSVPSHVCVCVHAHTHDRVHVCIYKHACVCMPACLCTFTWVCMSMH